MIVLSRARLVAKGSTIDEFLVGDPHRLGRRDIEKPVPGHRLVDGGTAMYACVSSVKGLALVAVMLV